MLSDAFRDLEFDPEYHIYKLRGKTLTSVTKTIEVLEEPFNAEQMAMKKAARTGEDPEVLKEEWAKSGEKGRNNGTLLHSYAECVLKGSPQCQQVQTPEMIAFDKFWAEQHHKLTPAEIEWKVCDEEFLLGGTIDAVFFCPTTGLFHLFDWKTGKLVLDSPFGSLKEPFTDFTCANFNKYSLQLSIYRLILERNTNLTLGDSYLVHFKPDCEYGIFKALDLRVRADSWLRSLKVEF